MGIFLFNRIDAPRILRSLGLLLKRDKDRGILEDLCCCFCCVLYIYIQREREKLNRRCTGKNAPNAFFKASLAQFCTPTFLFWPVGSVLLLPILAALVYPQIT
jgi:hypothetical protein